MNNSNTYGNGYYAEWTISTWDDNGNTNGMKHSKRGDNKNTYYTRPDDIIAIKANTDNNMNGVRNKQGNNKSIDFFYF